MAGKTAIIIGASRGLGLGLAGELAKRGWQVTATQRTPSAELAALPGVAVETLDIDDAAAITALKDRLSGQHFDLVFVNAGVYGPMHQSADKVTPEEFAALMLTNALAPIRVARALLPQVNDGGTMAFMTSILGSVAGNTFGTMELYRASKAALNSLSRGFAATDIGQRPVGVINFHPGWVQTAMGGPGADITVETSVTGIANVIEAGGSGHRYLDYTGTTIPW
jgi:NAD(P)-dependent dehydrogenase (short-subunit alcohol dehydrogenase family)